MYRVIMMTCGYVESSRTSWLIYQCEFFGLPGFETRREALKELALDMYAKYQDEHAPRVKPIVNKCCKKAVTEKHDFCPSCGRSLNVKDAFDSERFMEFVNSLHDTTADSYGESEYACDRSFKWWPFWSAELFNTRKEEVVYIPENAEQVVLGALYDAMPELKEMDDGFSEDFNEREWKEIIDEKKDMFTL